MELITNYIAWGTGIGKQILGIILINNCILILYSQKPPALYLAFSEIVENLAEASTVVGSAHPHTLKEKENEKEGEYGF